MTDAIVAPPRRWIPEYRCCWCGSTFVTEIILGQQFWRCPTDACFARCLEFQIMDDFGQMFYLPMPRQVEVEEAVASGQYRKICHGGAVAGGKSRELRMMAYRYCRKYPNFHAILLRRTMPELRDTHIFAAVREVSRLTAKCAAGRVDFKKNGSLLRFAHCQNEDDWEGYKSAEFDLVLFDQLEMFLFKQFRELSARTGRIRRVGWRGTVVAGENPGGPGSLFVDEVFISKTISLAEYPQYNPAHHHFIKAELEDNPYIDEGYEDFLGDLDPQTRDQYRWGSRDVFPGQYFKTFGAPDRIQELAIPLEIPRIGGLHWGYFRPGVFLWGVVLPHALYIEREHVFAECSGPTVAKAIIQTCQDEKITLTGSWGNPPSEIPESEQGEDVFETLRTFGLAVYRSRHDRVSGWLRLQDWLTLDETPEGPRLRLIVHPRCRQLIRTLPQLLQHATNKEDVSDEGPEQPAAALRNLVMSRPSPVVAPTEEVTGRDLSKLDPKTRADILRMREFEADEPEAVLPGDRGWPLGPDWGSYAVSESEE